MPPPRPSRPRTRRGLRTWACGRALVSGLLLVGFFVGIAGCPAKPTVTPGALDAIPETAAIPTEPETEPEATTKTPAIPTRPPPQPIHSREAASPAIARGNHEGAIGFLTTWLQGHPEDVEATLLLAHAQAALGEVLMAEAILADPPALPEGAAAKLAAKVAILGARARLHRARGDLGRALALLREALALAPGDLPTQGALLSLLRAQGAGATPEAKAVMEGLYDAYEADTATHAEDLLAVAEAALARGTSGAFHDANMVLGEAETAPVRGPEPEFIVRDRVLLLRGAMFHEKYASADATATYGLILDRDPWHADALSGLARVVADDFNLGEATRLATQARETAPNHPLAAAILGRIAVIEGRRPGGRALAEAALTIHPHHHEALAVLAAAAIFDGDERALADLEARALVIADEGRRYAVTLSELLVALHLYPEADAVLRRALGRTPDDPYLQSSFGLNLLRLGDEEGGRAALAKAWARDRFNERTRNVLELYDRTIAPDYTELRRGELLLRLPKADQRWVAPGIEAAYRRARRALDQLYGIDPGDLRLEVFADPESFSIRTVGVPSLGALGVCFGPVITLVGPYRGTHNLDQVIWHELAHVYAIRLSRGRVPRWFTEGLSEWESEVADPAWARESAALLDAARRRGELRRLGELELAFLRAESPRAMEIAYATAAYALRYLGETYGHAKLRAILRGYASGATTEALFEDHLGRPFAAIEADFDADLRARLGRTIRGWSPETAAADDPRLGPYQEALAATRAADADGAKRALHALIDAGGDGYTARMALAEFARADPKSGDAEAHLQEAKKFHREAIEPLVRLSELAHRRGDLAAEKGYLREALAIDAMSFDPAARLVMLALISGDAEALTLARARALALAPLHPLSLGARALAAAKAGDRGLARALYDRAREATPRRGPSDTLVVLALAAAAVGDPGGARELAEAAASDPKLSAAAAAALAPLRAP